jgi:hypothetical protein
MLFLVDGYNATMNDPTLSALSKEGQRDALLAQLSAHGRARLGAGDIVAVFDARDSIVRTSESIGKVKAVFAPDADDEIVRRAQAAKVGVTVVTGDMRLRARLAQDVRRRVEFRDTSAVWSAGGSGKVRGGGEVAREEGISRRDAQDITAELGEIWLNGEE